jgi:hypothetical protein
MQPDKCMDLPVGEVSRKNADANGYLTAAKG